MVCLLTMEFDGKMRAEDVLQPTTKIRIRFELERPTQSELHHATSLVFSQRRLRRSEFAKVCRSRRDRRKAELPGQKRIDGRNGKSARRCEPLDVGYVENFPTERNRVAL